MVFLKAVEGKSDHIIAISGGGSGLEWSGGRFPDEEPESSIWKSKRDLRSAGPSEDSHKMTTWLPS